MPSLVVSVTVKFLSIVATAERVAHTSTIPAVSLALIVGGRDTVTSKRWYSLKVAPLKDQC